VKIGHGLLFTKEVQKKHSYFAPYKAKIKFLHFLCYSFASVVTSSPTGVEFKPFIGHLYKYFDEKLLGK